MECIVASNPDVQSTATVYLAVDHEHGRSWQPFKAEKPITVNGVDALFLKLVPGHKRCRDVQDGDSPRASSRQRVVQQKVTLRVVASRAEAWRRGLRQYPKMPERELALRLLSEDSAKEFTRGAPMMKRAFRLSFILDAVADGLDDTRYRLLSEDRSILGDETLLFNDDWVQTTFKKVRQKATLGGLPHKEWVPSTAAKIDTLYQRIIKDGLSFSRK